MHGAIRPRDGAELSKDHQGFQATRAIPQLMFLIVLACYFPGVRLLFTGDLCLPVLEVVAAATFACVRSLWVTLESQTPGKWHINQPLSQPTTHSTNQPTN